MKKIVYAALGAALLLTGCDSLKEAMSAHPDTVAKAAGEELSVTRLADLLGKSKAPLRREVATAVADLWVNYQLLADAAVNNDSIKDTKVIDRAMWAQIANIKARKWYEQVSKTWKAPDSTQAEANYNDRKLLAASHILLLTQDTTPAAKAAVKQKIDALRTQVSSANFAELARKNSQDPQSAVQGGSLGLFPRGQMVKEFEDAAAALGPGEISPVIQTQYGYHIIRRPTFSEVRPQFVQAILQGGTQEAEAAYLEGLEKNAKVEVKQGTVATVRAVIEAPMSHRDDNTVIATSAIGKFTASDLSRWMETFPPQAQIAERVKAAPDSMIPLFVKNFVRNELVLHSADSAKLVPTPQEMTDIRRTFTTSLGNAWSALNLDPKALATAAKSKGEREKLAAKRVEEYVGKLLAQEAQYVDITQGVQNALRDKYDYKINTKAFDQVLLDAAKIRIATDSTTRASQPPTVVPLPNQDTTKK